MHQVLAYPERRSAVVPPPPFTLHNRSRAMPHRSCRRVAEDMGLEEGRDYVHVCLGTNFEHLIDNLQNEALPEGVPRCDVGASSVTATAARKTAGLEFSQATYRNKLAVLVHGKIESGGVWGFFKPLNTLVWVAVAATIFVVPFFVFFCEYVLLHRCAAANLPSFFRCKCYARHVAGIAARGTPKEVACLKVWPFRCLPDRVRVHDLLCKPGTPRVALHLPDFAPLARRHISYGANSNGKGAGSWAANLKEAIWHSLAYTMSIDVFVVSSTPARMVVVAYCFVVMIIANTCAPCFLLPARVFFFFASLCAAPEQHLPLAARSSASTPRCRTAPTVT